MLDARELTTYARSMSNALKVIGPTPYEHVVAMLHGLELTHEEARAVIAHALAAGILTDDNGKLLSGPTW